MIPTLKMYMVDIVIFLVFVRTDTEALGREIVASLIEIVCGILFGLILGVILAILPHKDMPLKVCINFLFLFVTIIKCYHQRNIY